MLKVLTATEAELIYNTLRDAYDVAEEYSETWLMQNIIDALEILGKLKQATAEEVIK